MALADTEDGIRIQCHCGNEFFHVRIPGRAGRNPARCCECRRTGKSKPKVERETPYIVPDIEGFPEVPSVGDFTPAEYEMKIQSLRDQLDLAAGELRSSQAVAIDLRLELARTKKDLNAVLSRPPRSRDKAMTEVHEACRPRLPSDISSTVDRRVRVREAMDRYPETMSDHIKTIVATRRSPPARRIGALLDLAADCVQEIARIQRSSNSV